MFMHTAAGAGTLFLSAALLHWHPCCCLINPPHRLQRALAILGHPHYWHPSARRSVVRGSVAVPVHPALLCHACCRCYVLWRQSLPRAATHCACCWIQAPCTGNANFEALAALVQEKVPGVSSASGVAEQSGVCVRLWIADNSLRVLLLRCWPSSCPYCPLRCRCNKRNEQVEDAHCIH